MVVWQQGAFILFMHRRQNMNACLIYDRLIIENNSFEAGNLKRPSYFSARFLIVEREFPKERNKIKMRVVLMVNGTANTTV